MSSHSQLMLDHPERMLDLGAYLGLGFLDLALGFVQHAALTLLPVRTAAGRYLPDHLPAFMFRALLYAGVTRVGPNPVFLAVQQLVDLSDIRYVGRRAYHAVHHARLVIYADVSLHTEVVLVAFLGLVHFRVCLRLPEYSASAKVICFIGKLRQRDRRISTDLGSPLQDFPKLM